MDYDFSPDLAVKKKMYELIEKDNIILVNWNGLNFDVRQIFQAYDVTNRHRNGLLITDKTAKELYISTNRHRKKALYRGDLYFKVRNSKHGLFEVTLVDTHIKQMDPSSIWFHHDGISSLRILEKAK